jgi:hypothetical protein
MERSALGRSILVVAVLIVSVFTGQSTFGETIECRASPGPPAAQGMRWYYRVDRTKKRYCWYLQAAGLQVRSHEIVPLSKPRPQIVAEQSLTSPQRDTLQPSPSQPAIAEDVLIEPNEPPVGAPSAAHFSARWLDLPESMDLGADDFARPRSDDAVEHASPHSEGPILSTQFVAADTISQLPHKSNNAVKFAFVFIAGALSIVIFRGLLKLTRVLASALTRPRLKSELDDGSVITLSELMRVLRRVDATLETTETRRYSPLTPREHVADERASKRDDLDRRAHSVLSRLSRGHPTDRPVLF